MAKWDDQLEEFESQHGCVKPLVIMAAIFILIGILVLYGLRNEYRTFMEECLEDGRKRYECVSMYRGTYTHRT